MKKIYYLFLLSFVCLAKGITQIPQAPTNVPSPQTWNFTQYGKLPISYFTGLPNITVSLDEVEQTGFKLPISLNYNLGSVRPDIHPGATGMGWNLSLGGVVSRKIRGLTDEFDYEQRINYHGRGEQVWRYFNGYRNISNGILNDITPASILSTTRPALCNSGASGSWVCSPTDPDINNLQAIPQTLPYLWDDVTYMHPSCNTDCKMFWAAATVGTGMEAWNYTGIVDRQPDEFSFNVMGLSGKFFLPRGNDNEVKDIICDKKVKIRVSGLNENDPIPTTLKVPDYRGPLGTSDNLYYNMSPWQRNKYYPKTISSFTIQDEEGNTFYFGRYDVDLSLDAIEYGINIYDISQDYWTADSWFLTKIQLQNGKSVQFEYERGPFQTSMYNTTFESNTTGTTLINTARSDRGGRLIYPTYLKKIYGEDFNINLRYSESSQLRYEDISADLYNTTPSIQREYLYNKYSDYTTLEDMKWLKLDQIEVTKGGMPAVAYNLKYNNIRNQRLMLQKITSFTSSGDSAVYSFTYDTSKALPSYLSCQTDHWEYWNGKSPTNNNPTFYYQDKQPDTSYLFAGTLKQIRYPTGGYTNLIYEPNEYNKIVKPDRTKLPDSTGNNYGGGLRIKMIADYDGINTTAYNTREFIYKKGYTKTLTPTLIKQLPSSGILNMKPQYYWTARVPYYNLVGKHDTTTFAVGSSQPLYYTTDDYQIGYSEVTEKLKDSSYSVYKFSNHDNGFQDEAYEKSLNDVFNSPFTKYTSMAFTRGKLLEQLDFDSGNVITHKKTISYKVNDTAKPAYRNVESNYFNTSPSIRDRYIIYNKMVLYGTKFKMYKHQFLPDLQTDYTYQNGTNPIKTSTQYFYDNPKHGRASRIITTNSSDEEETSILKYAQDYSGEFMLSRIADYRPGTVLEKLQLKKDAATGKQKVINGELNEYALPTGSSGMPWLNYIYQLQVDQPFDYSTYTPTVPLTRDFNSPVLYKKDSRYKITAIFTSYDKTYHPTGIENQNGEKVINIYGNKDNDIIASINTNAGNTDSSWAYTSFEEYRYLNSEGYYYLSEYDGTSKFTYQPDSFSVNAFTGSRSFSGVVTSKTYNYSTTIYVNAMRGKAVPTLKLISKTGVVSNGPAFEKIAEKGDWNIYKTMYFLNGGAKVQVNSNGNFIDELRIQSNAPGNRMTTYTYSKGKLMCNTDAGYNRNYYEYDGLGRLKYIRDEKNNVIKKIDYWYQTPTPEPFYSAAQSKIFIADNCCFSTGSSVTYTVIAGVYSSFISQADADQKAINDINTNGQAYANKNATCARIPTCTGNQQKPVNCACETGRRVNTATKLKVGDRWSCVYHYEWSDGTKSPDYTDYSPSPCELE